MAQPEPPPHAPEWSFTEARAKFSQVVRQAKAGTPQRITRRGETVVVVSVEQWRAALSKLGEPESE